MDPEAVVAEAEAIVQCVASRAICVKCCHTYALHRRLGSCMGAYVGRDERGRVFELPCRCMARGPLGVVSE